MLRTLLFAGILLSSLGWISAKEIDDQQNGTPTSPPGQVPVEPDPTSPPDAYDTSSYPAPAPEHPRDQDCSTPVTGPCLNVRLCSCW